MTTPHDHPSLSATALEPPENSRASTVLNGAGNGMMLGTLPFVAFELYSKLISKKELPMAAHKASAFLLVGGCALGTWYGIHEARQIQNYREAVNDQLTDLRKRVNDTTAKVDSWTEKHDAKQAAEKAEGHAR